MKKGLRAFLLSIIVFLLCSCTNFISYKNIVSVALLSSDHIKCDNQIEYINQGNDISFIVEIENGYSFSDCDYEKYELVYLSEDRCRVILYGIKNNVKVKISVTQNDATLNYYANGGIISTGGDYYSVNYSLKNHKRPNTINGNGVFSRPGYQLIAWNTKSDGSGDRIGLGSRVTVDEITRKIDLYAMWEKESDASLFDVLLNSNGVTISNYKGNEEKVVVPTKINDRFVIAVASNCFVDKDIKEVYLPVSVTQVGDNAFVNCKLESLTMHDSLVKINDAAFVDCDNFKTLFINAYYNPVIATKDRHSFYCDKVDLLILSGKKDTPRMILEGDSGVWFNVHGQTIASNFRDKYQIVNMGLNGFYNAVSQHDIIKHFLRTGDQFIHVVVPNSVNQIYEETKMTTNMWAVLELNYDLFSYVDLRKLNETFNTYSDNMAVKLTLKAESYEQAPQQLWIDDYGCIPFYMPKVSANENLLDDVEIKTCHYSETNKPKLHALYEEIESLTGKKPMYGFGCINYDGLIEEERTDECVTNFVSHVKTFIGDKAYVIDDLKDNIYRGEDCYYTNFHLTTDAGVYYTTNLIRNIRRFINE